MLKREVRSEWSLGGCFGCVLRLLLWMTVAQCWVQVEALATEVGVREKITSCESKPDFVSEAFSSQAPANAVILAARTAHLWIESNDVQILVRHNFKSGQRDFVCASLGKSTKEHFQILAPTILDRTIDQKTGTTVWQFQVSLDGSRLGSWNQVTRLVPVAEILAGKGQELSWSNSPDDYQLRVKTKTGEFSLTLVVEYDLVPPEL